MAWKTEVAEKRDGKQFTVMSEAITTKAGSVTTSSVVDFIPAGVDFAVVCNSAGTNLSTSTHVELQVGYTSTGSYYRWNKAGFNATSALIDNATKVLFYDASANGQFPFYKFKFPLAGGSVTMKVIWGDALTV